ncbi:RagB/SusD family nutrient uptake outer membrane protein [Riemerella anatipestifer]|uniref:RagB/SusD family nutrient uptake outer membrane protein n=1 Tax=Riemerella anatipestifer TaxID=34085 RepID=UPI00129E0495|nr:RagB/SusD family nutrient uptake outer membrane protein [Riemerella anatipestifer]MRM82813.1 RagB/SusD family nutrient uptake outer membrane protein [Riemerella anatipestifer]
MRKILYLAVLLGGISLVPTSCSRDFLEEPKPTDTVTDVVVYSSKESAMSYMSGILRRSRGQYLRDDAANMGSMFFARSLKGNDLIQALSWFTFDYDNNNREPTYTRTIFSWKFPYELIGKLNVFILGVKNSSQLSSADKDYLLGQALAYRGFLYFQLSLEFQHTYTYDPSLPAPPIYKEITTEGKPMSTQKELYEFILEDLKEAVRIASSDRPNKSYWNKEAASAVLAQVYQVMGRWDEAAEAARLAYGGNISAALDAKSYTNGFNDMDASPEWLWCTPQSEDQSAYYWTAPFAFIDHTAQSYYATYVNENFVSLFSASDVRNLFSKTKFTDWRKYTTTKFKFNFSSDVPFIRKSEMVLIEAEALYHINPSKAHDVLYALQKNRDPQAVKSSNTGAALLEEILVERRKELYAECGVEWFDAKRLRRGITRTNNHRIVKNLSPDDKRFFLKIPQAEIDANEYIDESVNLNR